MLKTLAIAGVLALAPLAAGASQLPDYPFIHVSAEAGVNAIPDIGTIDFEIIASDPDPAAARAVVEARIAELGALVSAQGLPPEDVEIRDVVQDIRKADPATAALVYDIKCSVHLNVRNITKWEAVAGGLLGKPNLDNFATSFDSSQREKVEMDLMAEAMRNARRRGEAMAAGLGRKLGPVTAVTVGSLKNLGNAMGLVASDFAARDTGPRATRGEPRDILRINALKLAQPVDVIFRIK